MRHWIVVAAVPVEEVVSFRNVLKVEWMGPCDGLEEEDRVASGVWSLSPGR